MTLQHLRSSTANKRPDPTAMADGQIALNTAAASPGLFYKDSAGNLVKAGPVHVGSTAPNVSPASGGTAGNSTGEAWLDTSGSNPLLKIWSGAAWQTVQPVASGTVVSTADTGSVTSTMIANGTIVDADVNASAAIAGTKVSPNFGSQTITTTGVVSAAAGAAATPSITFTGDLNTGIYSPGADQVAISTGGAGRLFIDASGNVGVGGSPTAYGALTVFSSGIGGHVNSTSGAAGINFYENGAGRFSLRTLNGSAGLSFYDSFNASERLRIDSSGRVGIGTSSPSELLNVSTTSASDTTLIRLDGGAGVRQRFFPSSGTGKFNWQIAAQTNVDNGFEITPSSASGGSTFSTPAITVKSDGKVGIGTASPAATTHCAGSFFSTSRSVPSSGVGPELCYDTGDAKSLLLSYNRTSSAYAPISIGGSQVELATGGTERARIDSSGRLLVGTSSSDSNFDSKLQIAAGDATASSLLTRFSANSGGPVIYFGKSRSASVGTKSLVSDGDTLGGLEFYGSGSSNWQLGAKIEAQVDGTPESGGDTSDMPSRLVFSTTADGASSPTERMRITQNGRLGIGTTDTGGSITEGIGAQIHPTGYVQLIRSSGGLMALNRRTDDGELLTFFQDNAQEGSISVSGTTVSYNGAHLSRWSQLPSGVERTEILRGSVLSNIDEMCEWPGEENEQLNRMKVSDVEGDKNVSGVFQGWDDDDDTYTNDFYCAMTGDFIIRIAQGVTVERGDLLMSAGDGTAKPQDDDIIRSKTIAKVTSTNVSCTYDDGSYCVPCVLMAC